MWRIVLPPVESVCEVHHPDRDEKDDEESGSGDKN
jgi:hypothetical protein